MNNLLELGKNMVKEIKYRYMDDFYRYVDADSFEDKTYIDIATKLFENKEKFLDYMNYLYVQDFDWLNSEINSFDFIQNLVDLNICESGKYCWYDKEECFIPVIQYSDSLKDVYEYELPTPCIIKNSKSNKEIYIESYDDYNKGYNVLSISGETLLFLEEGVDDIYDYLNSELDVYSIELNGLLNLYLEINQSIWNSEIDSEYLKNKITNEKENIRDLFEKCLEELIESNPAILKKYGLNQILLNVHEVNVQEV